MAGGEESLASNYADTGYSSGARSPGKFTLAPGDRPALLVIDVVQAYLDESSPLYAPKLFHEALSSIKRMVAEARSANIPVIYTVVAYHNNGADGGTWYARLPKVLRLFDEGSKYGAFAPGISPSANELVIVKQYASAFFGTSLSSALNRLKINTTVTVGFSTSGCIRATALDACQHGYISMGCWIGKRRQAC